MLANRDEGCEVKEKWLLEIDKDEKPGMLLVHSVTDREVYYC